MTHARRYEARLSGDLCGKPVVVRDDASSGNLSRLQNPEEPESEGDMRQVVGRVLAVAVVALTAVLLSSQAEASAKASFPGRQVGSTQPCATGAAENGQGAHFEDRGGGVCWVNLPPSSQ